MYAFIPQLASILAMFALLLVRPGVSTGSSRLLEESPRSGSAAAQELSVRAGERDSVYYFSPDEIHVQPGAIRVTFINDGARPHTFNVKRADEWRDLYNFPLVQSGESDVFEFELWQPGSYVFFCQLYKHIDHGQTGVFIVSPG